MTDGERYDARSQINAQLKRFIARIEFAKDGKVMIRYGEHGKVYADDPDGKWQRDYSSVPRQHPSMAGLRLLKARNPTAKITPT